MNITRLLFILVSTIYRRNTQDIKVARSLFKYTIKQTSETLGVIRF